MTSTRKRKTREFFFPTKRRQLYKWKGNTKIYNVEHAVFIYSKVFHP
jgi:hypothetical protein